MDLLTNAAVIGGVVGGACGGLAVLAWSLSQPGRSCPACEAPLPRFRRPTNARQRWRGGWTCGSCGAELDRRGRLVEGEDGHPRP